ncbi:signal peptidase I family protein [Cryptosporidium serpentis]
MIFKNFSKKGLKLLQILGVFHIFHEYLLDFCIAVGPSMLPTIGPSNEILIYERLSRWFPNFKSKYWPKLNINRNDIVIAISKDDPEIRICKRVLAIANDLVTVCPDFTIISKLGDIHNIDVVTFTQCSTYFVPPGHVWLQGDNSKCSRDSRHYGPVPKPMISGKVLYKIWPPNSWGSIYKQN